MSWVNAGCDTYNEACKIAETTDYAGLGLSAIIVVFAVGLFIVFSGWSR
jgi:hypothetical protein